MALLNWGGQYSNIKTDYVGIASSNSNYVKLLFTNSDEFGTGHIITHGIDYTPDYTAQYRGFVPQYALDTTYSATWNTTKGQANGLLFGDGKWRYIRTVDLPIVDFNPNALDSDTYTDEVLFSALSVKEMVDAKIEHSFKANDAMQFIGGIKLNGSTWETTPSVSTLDSGYTFKATEEFTLGTERVEPGDMLIYIGDDNAAIGTTVSRDQWLIIEGNVQNVTTYTINGEEYKVESQDAKAATIFAPTTAGTSGQILYSDGSDEPKWTGATVDSLAIVSSNAPRYIAITDETDLLEGNAVPVDKFEIGVGKLLSLIDSDDLPANSSTPAAKRVYYDAATLFGNFQLVEESDKVKGATITVGDTVKSVEWAEAGKVWDITASAVEKELKVDTTTGIKFETADVTYNGTEERTLSLLTATKSQLGVIRVDTEGSAIDKVGKGVDNYEGLPTVSMDNGLLYLTKDNVCAALGFEPGNIAEAFQYDLILAGAKDAITEINGTVANPFVNLTSFNEKEGEEGKAVTGSINFVSSNAISVIGSMIEGVPTVTIDTPHAYTGIQVRTDANTETALSAVHSASSEDTVLEFLAGVGIALEHAGTSITINTNLESSNEKHLKITPDNSGKLTFESIWRDVQINGTTIGEDTNINFVSTPDVVIATNSVEAEGAELDEIGFCIAWHNLETNATEVVAPNAINYQV